MVLGDIAARRAVGEHRAEADAARDQRDLAGRDLHAAEFGQQREAALLRHEQQLAIGVHEHPRFHVAVGGINVQRDALQVGRIAVGQHRRHAVDQVGAGRGVGDRIPTQSVGGERRVDGAGGEALRSCVARVGRVLGGWPHPVQPTALVLVTRRGEGAARELFGVEAEGGPLRRVAADGKGAGDGLGRMVVAEAGEVGGVGHNSPSCHPGEGRGPVTMAPVG